MTNEYNSTVYALEDVVTMPSPGGRIPLLVFENKYILDGHHRYGQVMLSNPKLKMRALRMPLDIHTLIKISRSYGNAIGNKQKA